MMKRKLLILCTILTMGMTFATACGTKGNTNDTQAPYEDETVHDGNDVNGTGMDGTLNNDMDSDTMNGDTIHNGAVNDGAATDGTTNHGAVNDLERSGNNLKNAGKNLVDSIEDAGSAIIDGVDHIGNDITEPDRNTNQ